MGDALPVIRDGCRGYPVALALIGANLKTGEKGGKVEADYGEVGTSRPPWT